MLRTYVYERNNIGHKTLGLGTGGFSATHSKMERNFDPPPPGSDLNRSHTLVDFVPATPSILNLLPKSGLFVKLIVVLFRTLKNWNITITCN